MAGRLLTGIVLAALVGLVIGVAMARREWVERLLRPIMSFLLPIPPLIWTLIVYIWFEQGNPQKVGSYSVNIFIVAFAAALPAISTIWSGLKATFVQAAVQEKISLWKTIIPLSLPLTLSGLRIGLPRAIAALLAVEGYGYISGGISVVIFESKDVMDISFLMVIIATLAAIVLFLDKIVFQGLEWLVVRKRGMREVKVSVPPHTFF